MMCCHAWKLRFKLSDWQLHLIVSFAWKYWKSLKLGKTNSRSYPRVLYPLYSGQKLTQTWWALNRILCSVTIQKNFDSRTSRNESLWLLLSFLLDLLTNTLQSVKQLRHRLSSHSTVKVEWRVHACAKPRVPEENKLCWGFSETLGERSRKGET